MADANRIAAALRYQQGMALPTPEPDSMVGRALDAAAQWGRGVQKNVSDLVSPTAWAEALKNPPRGVLSQMNPENKQEMINQGIDSALNFGPAMLGKIVYHGSPHKFDAFDMSKIGTGEGAQAYGHGLYFAENPGVASTYTGGAGDVYGMSVKRDNGKYHAAAFSHSDPKFRKESYFDAESDANKWIREQSGGSLYKVDLPDDQMARMLDWDKPLSQQAPEVQKGLAALDPDMYGPKGGDYDPMELGQMIYQRLMNQGRDYAITAGKNAQTTLGASQAKAAEDLRAFGIPGIRYLDGGSRGAGQGSSNYVVFPGNEGLLSILERNGMPLK